MKQSPRSADAYDIQIGKRLKLRRLSLGLTQKILSERLGISYQQIQKYEAGKNRISSGKLFHIAQVLDVPVTWFFENINTEISSEAIDVLEDNLNHDIVRLIALFSQVKSKAQRRAVLAVLYSMVEPYDTE